MSEYQYYEFQAVDRALTREQMASLRSLSSRAVITANSFSNTYDFGSFRGDPRTLMESFFDAHVYVSNFGTVRFMLRLPPGVLAEDTLTDYATTDNLNWWITDKHTILEWELDEDPPDEWVDGEGWMAQLLPLREELVRGDYRSLYIGWLASIAGQSPEEDEAEDSDGAEDDEEDDSDWNTEPPVPPGLGALTGAQAALAEFLGVDADLIAAAAAASPEIKTKAALDRRADVWVAQLPEHELRAIVVRIIEGEGMRVQTELQSRYYRSGGESAPDSQTGVGIRSRTANELLTAAEKAANDRKRRELKEKERKRHDYLEGLVPRFANLWLRVNTLADEKKASSYDQACTLLVDMRDAYGQVGRRPEFDAEIARYRDRHSHRPALMSRLQKARVIS